MDSTPNSTLRRRSVRVSAAAAGLCIAVLFGTVACGTDSGSANRSATAATTTQPAVTQPAVTQPAVTQPAVPQSSVAQPAVTQPETSHPAVFATPSAAAKALFKVWTAKNHAGAAALALAPTAELDKLFAKPALPGAKLRTCDDGAFGEASCFFGNGQGGVSITLRHAGSGWSITNLDAY